MSLPNATRTTDGAPLRSTRQLLDELDALMDQMLALPVVDDLHEPAAPKPAVVPALSATLTLIDDVPPATVEIVSQTVRAEIPIKRIGLPRPARKTPEPPPPAVEAVETVVEVPPEALLVDDVLLAVPTFSRPAPRPLPPSNASWWYRTSLGWERAYRRITRWFGPLGWLMRTFLGRMTLGLAGLASLVIALGWLAKDLLQWPR